METNISSCRDKMTLSFKSFLTQFLRINVKKKQQDSFLLTLTIVDTNRRTRAATCRRMIPSSRSSIFTDDLDSNEKRRECLSACVCVCVCVCVDVSLVGHGCVAAADQRLQRNFIRTCLCPRLYRNNTASNIKSFFVFYAWGNCLRAPSVDIKQLVLATGFNF